MSLDDEPDEPAPKKTTKKTSKRDEDSDEETKKKPRKKRPVWVTLLALGCGGLLLLTCAGGAVLSGFFYYLNSQQNKVVGKWVADESASENASVPLLNRAMQLEFDEDKRCTMRLLGIAFTGKWSVIRNRENDAILVVVDFEDARGPDGQKARMQGKEKFQAAFEITPVDADHIDLVDVKERSVRMRMKKVESFDKTPSKPDTTGSDKPPVKKPDDTPVKKPDEPAPGPKYPLVLKGHGGPIWGLAFTADGSAVATACDDGKVRVFDPTTGQLRTTLSGHASAATGIFALPDGEFISTGGSTTKDIGEVLVWEPTGGPPKQKLLTSKNKVYALAGSPGTITSTSRSGIGKRARCGTSSPASPTRKDWRSPRTGSDSPAWTG
jgi:WD40 repeat protein